LRRCQVAHHIGQRFNLLRFRHPCSLWSFIASALYPTEPLGWKRHDLSIHAHRSAGLRRYLRVPLRLLRLRRSVHQGHRAEMTDTLITRRTRRHSQCATTKAAPALRGTRAPLHQPRGPIRPRATAFLAIRMICLKIFFDQSQLNRGGARYSIAPPPSGKCVDKLDRDLRYCRGRSSTQATTTKTRITRFSSPTTRPMHASAPVATYAKITAAASIQCMSHLACLRAVRCLPFGRPGNLD